MLEWCWVGQGSRCKGEGPLLRLAWDELVPLKRPRVAETSEAVASVSRSFRRAEAALWLFWHPGAGNAPSCAPLSSDRRFYGSRIWQPLRPLLEALQEGALKQEGWSITSRRNP